MGFKVDKNALPMERELIYLLADLCVKWGWCIPPEPWEQIAKTTYYSAEQFARDVVQAEGLDADFERRWVAKIKERFRERFGRDEIEASTFVDRVRRIKENW